jgi:ABC-2 type transport system ATP-binding protein
VLEYLHFTSQVRGLDEASFKAHLNKAIEVCGLAQSLGKTIGTLSHGYRQRVGLAQALIHDPPILILDEPTSDLDPNEKAEVLRYIEEIGKDHTILLSTHNLAEVEQACARAIIVSKGRVVADGPLDEIRSKTGRVRYVITIDEKRAEASNVPPTAVELQEALERMDGATAVKELPTDESAHKFELSGAQDGDLRAELFRLCVAKGWTLLELRREAQTLDAVFRDLTRADERLDRGRLFEEPEEEEPEERDEEDGEDEEDEGDEEAAEDEEEADEEAGENADEDEGNEDEDEDENEEDEEDEDEPSERKG